MTVYKNIAIGAAIASAVLIGAVAVSAKAEKQAAGDVYKPIQAITETFGSKHTVGYFSQENGVCAMTLFLAEATTDGEKVPSAARVKVNVKPGDKAELGSVEGQSVELTCGNDAATVEVRHGTFKAAYVTQ